MARHPGARSAPATSRQKPSLHSRLDRPDDGEVMARPSRLDKRVVITAVKTGANGRAIRTFASPSKEPVMPFLRSHPLKQKEKPDVLVGKIAKPKRTASIPVLPDGTVREQAAAIGALPGMKLAPAEVKVVLKRVAESAKDLFRSQAKAERYLVSKDFVGPKTNALHMIRNGQTATVLARLDELRYGPQG